MRLKPALARPEAEDVPGPGAYHNARTSASGPDSPSAPAYTMARTGELPASCARERARFHHQGATRARCVVGAHLL